MARMLIPASFSGFATETRMPVRAKSNGPSILRIRHFRSHLAPLGARPSAQVIESSSAVLVIETNPFPSNAHGGIELLGLRRHTACSPFKSRRLSFQGLVGDCAPNTPANKEKNTRIFT